MKVTNLKHNFVEYIPSNIEEGNLYISIQYATVVHKCACGCGNEVVTPLSPADWSLSYDGESVTLDPSIGNWSFNCHSHYWIRKNKIRWAERWSNKKIGENRKLDPVNRKINTSKKDEAAVDNESIWEKMTRWF